MTLRGERQADFAYQAVYRYMINLINEVSTDTRVKLPSLRQLARRLNVSISTIQYAYSLLEKEGRVYSVAKSGYYAWPLSSSTVAGGGGDLLDRLYAAARNPCMAVFSGDEPALLASLDGALLRLERELVRQYPRHLQPWSQPCGVWELRAALAARYTSSPTRCWHADDIYIGADLRGVLDILIEVLGLRGTTVIVESPCDWLILRLFQDCAVRIIELPWTPEGRLDLTTLDQLLRAEPVHLVLLSSKVSLPSGNALPAHDRLSLAQMLDRYGCWLLENDTFGELGFKEPQAALREWVNPERLMVFSSFEKILGAEAPYGYLLSRRMSSELQRQFLLRSFRLSSIRQRAIARLYQSGRIDPHLRALRQLLQAQAAEMSGRLDQHLGQQVSYRMPTAGAAFWLGSTQAVDMRQVFKRLLAQQVVIAPGELFSVSGLHHQHLRVSHTFHGQPNLEIALAAISEALRQAQMG
ncbi:PLP-dependent aminotransferase family protein [Pseudomonas extremorientalis]|jgi:DNA-binding transcriptional MocR family regulator|uniref:DNA-binding transcriptional regulator, MocR family, contains an aminotransferase domain n=1 Tax=Pseudomonas extremorientalis TaxID=169669 RepID=A0A1H0IX39_9PSED|nr:PLP-dependent aminotransferase family protein [Pseudomonas extremorientalis]KAB0512884.1 PLP-dependent aminotransferase family protein [Pseudomonas extremorientalis]OIN12640.1 GntR family transcriptional regulator [Pseudomonas extremorientalis]UUN91434.1 PLP-dependent aminotransferase family protein [Pseudomonas extremorientalis]WLG59527.1 PLP-dependent aminotransferase family protein [Pseudomonas extremorientalis]SDO35995.1 DNA-binding transcriptional regulator, MocR family, contains an am